MVDKKVLAVFENIIIKKISNFEIKDIEVLAKVDTGAFSGVIHAENIEEKDGILSFDLFGEEKNHFETKNFRIRKVRNTHGGVKIRYLLDFEIQIDGENYSALFGIDDRSRMKSEMLIGRAFLNKYGILVDSRKNIQFDEEWGEMKERQ